MTQQQSILRSMLGAVLDPTDALPLSDVILIAWKADSRFAMRGYPIYPDAKKIAARLCTMRQTGLLEFGERVNEQATYRVTKAGREEARGEG